MKVQFSYCDIDVDFEMEEADDHEVNPIPVLEGIIKLYNSITFMKSMSLTMKTSEKVYE